MAMTIKMTGPTEVAGEEVTQSAEPQASAGPVFSAYSVPVKTESFTIAAIAGLVACLFFAALVLVQWLELSYYTQPPSAFPLPGAGIAVSTEMSPPAASPNPAAPVAPPASS